MASAPALATAASLSHACLALAPGANLLGLLAAIDEAPGTRVFLDAADLPRALQTRTILTILRRRADRRGKRLHLVTGSQVLWRLARLAELDGVAASEAAAVSLMEPLAARMPDDAVPAVVIGTVADPFAGVDLPGGSADLHRAPGETGAPKSLGILARNELNLEPIPALDARRATSKRAPELPAPKLAALVAWLDADPRMPATGGSGPGGPEGPDDEPWLPAGASRGDRLPAPASNLEPPRLRVVRVGQDPLPRVRGALALTGASVADDAEVSVGTAVLGEAAGRLREGAPQTVADRRPPGRLLRGDIARDRLRDRAARRSLNRDRLDRLAGPRGKGPAVATEVRSIRTAATQRVEQVRRRLDEVAQHGPQSGRTAVAPMAIGAARAGVNATLVVLRVGWRLVSGVRLSGAAMMRLGATVVVSGVIGAFTWYVVPSATVAIVPTVETWSTSVPVVVDPAARKGDPATGRIPGRWVVKEATESG